MTYVIPSPGSKQLKHIDQQGHEELEAHDKTAFQAAATAAAAAVVQVRPNCWWLYGVWSKASDTDKLVVQGRKATTSSANEEDDEAPPPPVATPREVIEKLSAAKVGAMYQPALFLCLLDFGCDVSACLVSVPS